MSCQRVVMTHLPFASIRTVVSCLSRRRRIEVCFRVHASRELYSAIGSSRGHFAPEVALLGEGQASKWLRLACLWCRGGLGRRRVRGGRRCRRRCGLRGGRRALRLLCGRLRGLRLWRRPCPSGGV